MSEEIKNLHLLAGVPRRATPATATAARSLQALAVRPAGERTASAPQARGTPRSRRGRARSTTRRTRRRWRWRRRWRRRRRGSTSTRGASTRCVGHPSGLGGARGAGGHLVVVIVVVIAVSVYHEHVSSSSYERCDSGAYVRRLW